MNKLIETLRRYALKLFPKYENCLTSWAFEQNVSCFFSHDFFFLTSTISRFYRNTNFNFFSVLEKVTEKFTFGLKLRQN